MPGPYFLGVDVGTGSARAALIGQNADILTQHTSPLQTWRYEEDPHLFEQSGDQIWSAITECVRRVVQEAGVAPDDVQGIGFDATCSLVVVDRTSCAPIGVTPPHLGQHSERNVILWADHRAEEESRLINNTGHHVLDYVGGTMSLEMETPKILWLRQHLAPDTFERCEFFDLPDYLTFRASGARARSYCSLVCKCAFIPPGTAGSKLGWQPDFLEQIGLGCLAPDFEQLGGVPGRHGLVLTAGMPVGAGLSDTAARDLGLRPHTPVASALIDAYAGWVGTAAAGSLDTLVPSASLHDAQTRLVAIAGTSTCYCIQSHDGIQVPGVWGPYHHAVFPGLWMNEGGQSSTGQLIDAMIETHPAYASTLSLAQARQVSVFELLEESLQAQMHTRGWPITSPSSYARLVASAHMYPDFYGNRSPLADPKLRGMLIGLGLDHSRADLARKYILTLEAIALQTKHIVDEMNASGHRIEAIYLSGGGQARNRIYAQLVADVCGLRVQMPSESSASVVVGAAILGHLAADVTHERTGHLRATEPVLPTQAEADEVAKANAQRLWTIMAQSTPPGQSVWPTDDDAWRKHFAAKYRIFRECIELQWRWRNEMEAISF
ncbi:hypothetical protein MEQU1_003051 [Malassezia equina]|uniref:D-ribulokinase n=1 Tax=Malassezia equina TaxID=1381935 RepID=A0AAF0J054_9BASI|nr:hypothetical protein MEQU1_003051 [Malassezia equina]